ncbi:hypothetical protein CFR79_06950 [Komagataeibacter saccharivorans]|uniref:hypothetical protein n=1 Tax=Komagataeibacter saccharivorans TaxID=265959 RepID=UPI000D7BB319|nr:hypothetical protein [Komagataeibacter saccharivorans]PYD50902.1 hypothetical protein CFR79_06950 [Komagataeibacter saccharivorans]
MTTINTPGSPPAFLSPGESGVENIRAAGSQSSLGPSSGVGGGDTVTLSAEATAMLAQMTKDVVAPEIAYFAQFFPVLEGMDATALGAGVVDPAATSLSAGLSPDEIAVLARASIDAARTAPDGPAGLATVRSLDNVEWTSLMSMLDRPALAAVRANEGGLFTRDEQDAARTIMARQQEMAMGILPEHGEAMARQAVDALNAYTSPERMTAAIMFLDRASLYEKSTIAWVFGRAAAQVVYDGDMEAAGLLPDNTILSEFNIVAMVAAAMNTAQQRGPNARASLQDRSSLDDLRARLDRALARMREELGIRPQSTRRTCMEAQRMATQPGRQAAPLAALLNTFYARAGR